MESHNKDLFANRYRLEQRLGAGGFGEVWRALDTVTGGEMAVKIHLRENDEQAAKEIVKEYIRVRGIHHDHLLTPTHVGIADGNTPYLVMELCKGDLSDTDLEEPDVWRLLHDVTSGLTRLAGNQRTKRRPDGTEVLVPDPIIHQDIKPANILLRSNGMYAISDFGISKRRLSTLSTNDIAEAMDSAMSVDYAAPERFPRGKGVAVLASDIWSLGATLFEVVEGRRPFAECGGDCLNPTLGLKIPKITRTGYSAELKHLIYDCMATDSAVRPTAAQLLEYTGKAIAGDTRRVSWTGAPKQIRTDTTKRPSRYNGVPWRGEIQPKSQEGKNRFEKKEPATMYGPPNPFRRNVIKDVFEAHKKRLLVLLIGLVSIGAVMIVYPKVNALFNNQERWAWRAAKQENTFESYRTFIESYSHSKYVNIALLTMLRTMSTNENTNLGGLRFVWETDASTGGRNAVEIRDTIQAMASRNISFSRKSNSELLNYSFDEDYSNPQNLNYLEEMTRHYIEVDDLLMGILMFFSTQGSYYGFQSNSGSRCEYPVSYFVSTVQEDVGEYRDSLEVILGLADSVFCHGLCKLNEGRYFTTQDYKPYFDSAISIVNHYFQIRNKDYSFLNRFVNTTQYSQYFTPGSQTRDAALEESDVVVDEALDLEEIVVE